MRATAVEHEAEEKVPARAAESVKDGAAPVAALNGGELTARLLLGLQARAGNAAVAGLIQVRRKAEPPAVESAPAAATATEAEPATESIAEPRPGESDDALAVLDAGSDEAPAGGEANEGDTRELVAQDAQAELADAQAMAGGEASETPSGAAEPGVPIEARPPPVSPDVSTAEPSAGLARVGSLPPTQLLGSLGSVAAAVDRDIGQATARLASGPPQRARHPGAPSTVETPASTRFQPVDRPAAAAIPKVPKGRDVEVRRPEAPPVVPEPAAANGHLPTHDPGLELKPGPLPRLPLEGNADPAVVQQQHGHVVSAIEREHASGQHDAAQPMGEAEIFPTVPAETLRAAVPQAPGANGHGSPPAAEGDEAVSIVAQQEKGGEIQSAVSSGLASLAAERQQHAERTATETAKADAEMAKLEQANAGEQASERAAASREVLGLRKDWSGAQQELVAGAQREADAKTSETLQTVSQERGAAEQQAAAHYEQGQREADQARHEGEQQAAAERKKAQDQSSGGLLGALGSAAQSLFDKAKQAVQGVFDKARQLVRGAIERAQQLATAVMERAKQAIVGAIRLAGSVLVAIGDRVLVAFPALRDRFRKAIQDRIAAAETVVNKLANAVKQAVQGALNLLGATLSAVIGLLHRGMQAAIDGVRATVRAALDFARGAIAAFGTFAVLIKDIAADPVRWVSNLAAAARDGIRNHLWPDLKAGIQGWFKEKVDAILGLGAATWNLLKRGGIQAAQIVSFAWEAIKSMIPQMVIWVLIEKLVALIVPAAAAVMLIIQALQAAWGSLGRILQAFDAFVAFLKGVRWGNAGGLFGKALAAGAVAVVEFISQFLLQRLMGAAGAVAGKLRALAKRIGSRLAAVGRRIGRGAKWVAGKARRLGGKIKGFARTTVARPQVRWHTWRLERALKKSNPLAFEKLRQVKVDRTLDPTLKLEFLTRLRTRMTTGVDPRGLMTKIVGEDPERFCLQGAKIGTEEITSGAPLTKLLSLADVFDKGMLKSEYQAQFTSYDDWRLALEKNPTSFDPRIHLKADAEVGRWWSPFEDANEPTLEHAVTARQLSRDYATGAVRAHLPAEEAAKTAFHKPTAFDAMFFDSWQPPPTKGNWGYIKTQDGKVIVREAVAQPVRVSSCSQFEIMLPSRVAPAPELVETLESLP